MNISAKPYCLPLQLYKDHGKIKLAVLHNGVIFQLKYHKTDDALFNLALLSDSNTEDHAKLSFANYNVFIHTKNRKQYIGVTPEKNMCLASTPKTSEHFAAISMCSPEQTIM